MRRGRASKQPAEGRLPVRPMGRSSQATGGRRRRLMVGGDSKAKPPAFLYHAQRSQRPDMPYRQPGAVAEQRRKLSLRRLWAKRGSLIFASLLALVVLISVLDLSTDPKVVFLNSNGDYTFRDTNAYQQAAAKYLSSSFWNHNKITVNTGAAAMYLKQQFPELSSVNITLPLMGHRPIYYLKANSPTYILDAVNGSFVLDSNGKVLSTKVSAPSASIKGLIVITDQTGLHAKIGDQALGSDDANFIDTLVAELKATHVAISGLNLSASAAQELDVHISGQPYIVKFNMHDPSSARQQAGTYLATAHDLQQRGITPSQYIDVRVLGRAYYQ